jgi:hypothetical protein
MKNTRVGTAVIVTPGAVARKSLDRTPGRRDRERHVERVWRISGGHRKSFNDATNVKIATVQASAGPRAAWSITISGN